MRALLYYDQRSIKLSDIEIPKPLEGEILIKVTDAGLCQTQVNEFIEGPFLINKEPHSVTGKCVPIIAGHQFGGIVEKTFSVDDSWLIGKQAAVLPVLNFHGKEDNTACYGLTGENGGFAEYACVKKDNIFLTNEKNLLTFIEPILVGIHAGRKIKECIKNSKVCVLGAGALGICVAAIFRDFFGGNIVINDVLPNRLKRVKDAGFDVRKKEDLKREYDIVVDCAGSNPTSKFSAIAEAFSYLKNKGIMLSLGTYFHPVSIIPSDMLIKEQKIIASFSYDYMDVSILEKVIGVLKIDFSSFITNIKLNDIIEDGYYRSEVDKDSFSRLVVVP